MCGQVLVFNFVFANMDSESKVLSYMAIVILRKQQQPKVISSGGPTDVCFVCWWMIVEKNAP